MEKGKWKKGKAEEEKQRMESGIKGKGKKCTRKKEMVITLKK